MNRQNEEKIAEFWKKGRVYGKLKKKLARAKPFYFLDGPPYATGSIHIGTAYNKIIKDTYIRFWRMFGFNVWDQPGYDTHGLPIEIQVEKQLQIRSKSDIERIGIEKFIKECRNFATKYIDIMGSQFIDLGVWMDWSNPYLTLTNEYIEGAWSTFKIAYEKKLLYNGLYPVHVCPHCETAVAYNEIEYAKVSDPSVYVKFPVKDKNKTTTEGSQAIPVFLVIWTTTPWTLPANTGIMAHPAAEYVKVKTGDQVLILAKDLLETVMQKIGCKDYLIIGSMKGKELEGLKYEHPLADIFQFQKELKNAHRVILSEQFVTLVDGTGLVHTAPGHGEEDYKAGTKAGLPIVSPVKLNGTFDDNCSEYSGMFVKAADRKLLEELSNRGLLLHEEKVSHDYPHCWRCNSPLLQISVPQWFFRVTKIRDTLIKENKKVNWFPSWAKQRFENWLENLGDWPISRQRYWGIPLPIWTCECGNIKVIGSRSELPKVPEDFHKPYIDKITLPCKCGSRMKRIPDVLDVWFDSGVASWASLGYPKSRKQFNKLWPADLNVEGPDQIRGWWNSQLITSVITFGKAPFRNILFHGFILDNHGIKMSKSKGNVVTTDAVIEKYGRDVLRYYLLSSPSWDDFYFNWADVEAIAKSFIVIENTFNFIKIYVTNEGLKRNLKIEDKWILSKLNLLIETCTAYFSNYSCHKAAQEIHEFIVNDFSRWYIKIIRNRTWPAYEGKDKAAAFYTLLEVARTLSKLIAPVCPFLAEHAYSLSGIDESVHLSNWPVSKKKLRNKKLEKDMETAKKVVELANSIRKEKGIKLRWPLQLLIVNKRLCGMENLLAEMCNVKKVEFKSDFKETKETEGIKIYLETEITDELKKEALLREVIRKIQGMRKNNGYIVKDRISLFISTDELKQFEKEIKKAVGASAIKYQLPEKGEELVFEDKRIEIYIRRE